MVKAATERVGAALAGMMGGASPSAAGFGPQAGAEVVELLFEWRERAWQRQALGKLSDHMLRDIGISRVDAEREASKPFWRP